jgi:hypothetical protein
MLPKIRDADLDDAQLAHKRPESVIRHGHPFAA